MKNKHVQFQWGDEAELSRELDRIFALIDGEGGEVVQVTLLHNIGIVVFVVREENQLSPELESELYAIAGEK